ncbi:hypothetical protein [Pseudoflavitalea sp. G-6-1-2]|nr:hypothetical protein [Pseudoflavitalea sp. G-6-1-2]
MKRFTITERMEQSTALYSTVSSAAPALSEGFASPMYCKRL